jgi:hypothetical protein
LNELIIPLALEPVGRGFVYREYRGIGVIVYGGLYINEYRLHVFSNFVVKNLPLPAIKRSARRATCASFAGIRMSKWKKRQLRAGFGTTVNTARIVRRDGVKGMRILVMVVGFYWREEIFRTSIPCQEISPKSGFCDRST